MAPARSDTGGVVKVGDFFEGIEQVQLKVDGGKARFPIFYRDARGVVLLLSANLLKLRRMLPDPRFIPAQLAPGVGALALAAFEYHETDIGPYNEFQIGILLNAPYYAGVPCYNVMRQYLDRMYSIYVHRLPVTTEIALRAGIDFYNYPKFIGGIEFGDQASRVDCDLSRDGERILSISGAKVPTRAVGEMRFLTNLFHFRQPQAAEFKVNVQEGAICWMPRDVSWWFNTSNEIGAELSGAVLGSRAAMYLYMPKIQCVLYGPEHVPMPLLQRVVTSEGFLPGAAAHAAKKPAVKKKAARKPPGPKSAG